MQEPSNPAPDFRLRWSGHTDRGRVRQNNEDSFVALRFDSREAQLLGKIGEASLAEMDFIFAVSDGMGGANAGEFASRVTVEKITRLLPRAFKQAATIEAGVDDVLDDLFTQIHRALVLLGNSYEECAGMGATLSLCWFSPRAMHFAHVGDSRIYYLPHDEPGIRQVTHDDTHVGWLRRNGKINEREARSHPGRSSLQKALGAGNQFVDPQVGSVIFEKGDRFLLCTDGLVDGFYDAQLAEALHPPAAPDSDAAPALVRAAVANSGRDNTTALIVEVS